EEANTYCIKRLERFTGAGRGGSESAPAAARRAADLRGRLSTARHRPAVSRRHRGTRLVLWSSRPELPAVRLVADARHPRLVGRTGSRHADRPLSGSPAARAIADYPGLRAVRCGRVANATPDVDRDARGDLRAAPPAEAPRNV